MASATVSSRQLWSSRPPRSGPGREGPGGGMRGVALDGCFAAADRNERGLLARRGAARSGDCQADVIDAGLLIHVGRLVLVALAAVAELPVPGRGARDVGCVVEGNREGS